MIWHSIIVLALANLGQCKNVTTKTYGNSTVLWSKCGQLANHTLECATIHVPIDHWAKTPTNKTFSIPLQRMLSNHSDAKTILLNPGGPGGSGIGFLKSYGEALDKILDGRFHLLGFDPRGIGKSRPLARCEPDDARIEGSNKLALGPLVPSWDYAITVEANSADFFSGQTNWAKLCNETIGEHLPFINTPQTVADMNDILASIAQPKLLYYGTSYGTVIGTTYAQLFPERVERMAIDGVVGYTDYWGTLTHNGTVDLDAVFDGFLGHCLKERATCALADGYSNVTSLRTAIQRKLEAMDIDSVPVYINSSAYGILRGSDIRAEGIFVRMYSSSRWPYLARSLAYILQNEYLIPYLHLFGGVSPKNPRRATNLELEVTDSVGSDSDDAIQIVTYNDMSPKDKLARSKLTRKQILDQNVPADGYFAQDVGIADNFGFETWLLPRSHNLEPKANIKTAYPVLILSNTLDPVTPLKSAVDSSYILQDSVLLVQNAMGHCTVSKASKCTSGHLRAYFNDGVFPPAGTICEPDDPTYFPDPDLPVSKIQKPGQHHGHDMTLDQALQKLTEHSEALAAQHSRRLLSKTF